MARTLAPTLHGPPILEDRSHTPSRLEGEILAGFITLLHSLSPLPPGMLTILPNSSNSYTMEEQVVQAVLVAMATEMWPHPPINKHTTGMSVSLTHHSIL